MASRKICLITQSPSRGSQRRSIARYATGTATGIRTQSQPAPTNREASVLLLIQPLPANHMHLYFYIHFIYITTILPVTTRACGATHVPVHQIPRLSKQVAKIDCCILTTIFLCVCTKCANTPCIGKSTSHVTKRLISSFNDFIRKYKYFLLCCVSHLGKPLWISLLQ